MSESIYRNMIPMPETSFNFFMKQGTNIIVIAKTMSINHRFGILPFYDNDNTENEEMVISY